MLGLDVLLNVLQGIIMLGIRGKGESEMEMETVQSIREAVVEPWVVEVCQPMSFWCRD